ncbi:hypothetical protein DFH94DRAFT_777312 [Russula ochroleuca]|uniref:Uncharacterized protein n=1 Tax=Russula ochroleuca TaxID=152965 RepID=A0A9P5JXP2_9AGAM|nr:hypothetical protein DFH94DRAFT_777312 [Russula ochroleuca]
MSTDMPDGLSQVEQGLHGLASPDIREGNTQDSCKQQRSIPLGAPLTGNRLFTMSWVVGLGIPKAVDFYHGQSLISPTLDCVGGIIFTLTSLWLGIIEATRPELCPAFFKVDLAPRIMKFLFRDNVLLWFALFILAVKILFIVEHLTRRQAEKHATISEVAGQFSEDIPIRVMLGVSVAVFLLWLEGIMA